MAAILSRGRCVKDRFQAFMFITDKIPADVVTQLSSVIMAIAFNPI